LLNCCLEESSAMPTPLTTGRSGGLKQDPVAKVRELRRELQKVGRKKGGEGDCFHRELDKVVGKGTRLV
jgi:hypothetical protein